MAKEKFNLVKEELNFDPSDADPLTEIFVLAALIKNTCAISGVCTLSDEELCKEFDELYEDIFHSKNKEKQREAMRLCLEAISLMSEEFGEDCPERKEEQLDVFCSVLQAKGH